MNHDIDRARGSISRREILLGTAGLATAAVAMRVSAAEEHAGHAAGAEPKYSEAQAYKRHAAAVAAAEKCLSTGRACLSHCFETFVAGDTTMAKCAASVAQIDPRLRRICLPRGERLEAARPDGACVHRGLRGLREGVPRARGPPARVQGLRGCLCGARRRGEEADRLIRASPSRCRFREARGRRLRASARRP